MFTSASSGAQTAPGNAVSSPGAEADDLINLVQIGRAAEPARYADARLMLRDDFDGSDAGLDRPVESRFAFGRDVVDPCLEVPEAI